MELDPALRTATILDTGGKEIRLASLWADRPAILVFLRHFG
ncbi:MAG: hypothetical protein OEV00_05470 [Acidobacteriota bacterium]|nr:hypothetical protein [Acidobacteriota bacterium]MDH3784764.1 hypothetical protein [Acidobacteriota bacterium]